jgi:hypothetical protein
MFFLKCSELQLALNSFVYECCPWNKSVPGLPGSVGIEGGTASRQHIKLLYPDHVLFVDNEPFTRYS